MCVLVCVGVCRCVSVCVGVCWCVLVCASYRCTNSVHFIGVL